MKIGVLGTGAVGKTLAGNLATLGHDVTLGTRDPEVTLARTEPSAFGDPPVSAWLEQFPAVKLDTFSGAVRNAEIVFNATKGDVTLAVLAEAGKALLAGKVLIDVSNPLDFSKGMPPSLFVSNVDSLGEQVQRAFPDTKVVKSLNTVSAPLMVNPRQLADGHHTMFVCGNDAAAKTKVIGLLEGFGWTDVIDLGDITTARGTEMLLPIWVRLWGKVQSPMFNFKIVR